MTGEHEAVAARAPETPGDGPAIEEVREDLDELRGALAATQRALGTTNGRLDDVVRRAESLERDLAEVLGEIRGLRTELAELRPALLATLEDVRRDAEAEANDGNH